MARLSIDIDKIAVLRKLGNGKTPDPFHTAAIAEIAGVDGITVRLKETNSAITNRDLHLLKNAVHTSLNIEMPCNDAMLETALKISPDMITFVAVDDQGDSSDNTIDLNIEYDKIAEAIPRLQMQDILISLHIEPEVEMVKAAAKLK
ncbi:MAG: pyridoxine 5'-phosphate synthase, partial [candidate division Zixibacteria bacterium]|nr:pyridoxine 5'-phosphate synthase [candidate division Zixibacteria bacterium]